MPMADTPAHTPIALARSRGSWNTLVRTDSVAGMIADAPMPISARVPMSTVADGANADSAEPMPKITRPIVSARYRPKRSPRLPDVSSRPANTMVYASTIHCSSLADAPSPPALVGFASVGMATLRIVLSMPITIRLRHRTSSVSQRRRCATAGSVRRPSMGFSLRIGGHGELIRREAVSK